MSHGPQYRLDLAAIIRDNIRILALRATRKGLLGPFTAALRDLTTRLVIDLAELDFVDSTGLGTLVSVVQRVRHVGGEMTLRSPTPATRSVIEMTGLARVLPIRD